MRISFKLIILAAICLAAVASEGAIERHYWDGNDNAWKMQVISPSDNYIAISTMWDCPYQILAARKDAGVDRFIYIEGEWVLVDSPATGVKYVALAWNYSRQNQFYAARANGGIDRYYWDGNWTNDVVTASGNYVALAGSMGFPEQGYAAKADGGIDRIAWDGASWLLLPVTETGSYKALCPIYDNNYPNLGEVLQVAAVTANGGIGRWWAYIYPNYIWLDLITSGDYVAISPEFSTDPFAYTDYQIYAAKGGGGIDRAGFWPQNGVYDFVPTAVGKKYIALCEMFGGTYEVVGITEPGPATQVSKISEIRSLPANTAITLTAPVIASASSDTFSDGSFYILDDQTSVGINGGCSGIKIMPEGLVNVALGDRIKFDGVVKVDANTEKYVEISSITTSVSGNPPSPFTMAQKSTTFTGPETEGLLVKISGVVKYRTLGYAVVDDGSGISDPSGYNGIRVVLAGLVSPITKSISENDYVVITGLVGKATDGQNIVTVIRPRSNDDVENLTPQ